MQKIDRYDGEGNLIESIDTRTLEFTKEHRVLYVKQQCSAYILQNFPDFKQRNAGMGIYSEEENLRIISGVRDAISKCDSLEASINACATNDEVDAIDWNMSVVDILDQVIAIDDAIDSNSNSVNTVDVVDQSADQVIAIDDAIDSNSNNVNTVDVVDQNGNP